MNGNLLFAALALSLAYGGCSLCENQPQGSYVANPDNCSLYYKCDKGVGVIQQCPGDFLWKDENKWCDYPYNVDCGSRLNPHPPPQSLCSGLDGVQLADVDDCSKYFVCAKGYAVQKQCEGNKLWNDLQKWCDFPENVNCANGNATVPTPDPSGCPAIDGPTDILLPNPDDCSTFFKCFKGKPVLHKCPPGQLWNDDRKYCDYAENVVCVKVHGYTLKQNERDGATSKNSEQPETAKPEIPVECTGFGNVLLANPKDCGTFYQCVGVTPTLHKCGSGLHWNDKIKACDYPNSAGCQQ